MKKCHSKLTFNDLINNLGDLPNQLSTIINNAIAFLLALCFALGVILVLIGAIKWATGWDERSGKKTIVKGVVLIIFSLVLSGGILAGYLI
ncbi:MAG: hypothetical protein U9O98_02500 [Asgard group archaeon]|nr:hypothetical protein [Asgard group archaeon]